MSLMRMSESWTERCYDVWAKFYDYTFGALVHRRQLRAMQELRPEPGSRVLDLGVGTGMTLPHYPANVRVVGMDLSHGMLSKAQQKIDREGLTHCQLVQGDAMRPPFGQACFDQIMISHTISVVSGPERLLAICERMLKPGGRVIVLNHFRSDCRPIAMLERLVNPLCVKIGWKSDLSLEECLAQSKLELEYQFKLRTVDLWRIVVLADRRESTGEAS